MGENTGRYTNTLTDKHNKTNEENKIKIYNKNKHKKYKCNFKTTTKKELKRKKKYK